MPCAAAFVVLVLAQRKRGLVRAYGTVFSVAIAADAWLDGAWTPVKLKPAWVIPVFFVILGDFRYFVVLEEAFAHAWKLVRAAALAFVVPVTMQIIRWKVPRIEQDDRMTFLVYELLFLLFALAIRFLVVPRAEDRTLARRATDFELVMYGTWILADVGIIFAEKDAFYVVRMVANLLYYVALVPFMMKLLEKRQAR